MSDVITELANEANDKTMQIARLNADNAKLRELVRLMWKPFCWAQSYGACLTDEQDAEIRDKVRELGVVE